jgi:hypothetical protein
MSRLPADLCAWLLGLSIVAVASACSTFRTPEPFDTTPLRQRAASETRDGVRASAALLSAAEYLPVFGLDLGQKGVQPVWIEIENGSEYSLYFLATGVDAKYFSPLEVGHLFHAGYSGSSVAALDAHVERVALDYRAPIAPGATVSGFLYTNPSERTKVVDIDLLGPEWTTHLTLFVHGPDDELGAERLARVTTQFVEEELVELEGPDALRAAIEALPCCAQDEDGKHVAPLNVIVIGRLDQWVSACQRRGYRYSEVRPLEVFGRPQDAAGAKREQWIDAQPHSIRLWQTPLRYEGGSVWAAQVSSPRGGRFAADVKSLDPWMDVARDDWVEDLMYSQSLGMLGLAAGAGCAQGRESGAETDGLRAVVVFEDRAVGLGEIEFFDWERIAEPR